MIRWVACAFGVAAIAAAPVAASPSLRLATGGDACALDALPARVDALLGGVAIDPDARAVVRVEVARRDDRVTAAVTFEDADGGRRGPRRVEAASCDALLDALALVIAMGMPPDVPATAPPPAAPEPAAALELRAAPQRPATARPDAASELAVTAGGAASLSSNGWGQLLAVGLRWRHARHSLALELRLETPQAQAIGTMGTVEVAMTTIAAVGCRHTGDFAVCAALGAGEVRGSGAGLFDARAAVAPLISGGVRLAWEHEVWRGLRARLQVGADVSATTTQFDVDEMPVWTSSRVQAWAGAGMLAHFL